MHSSQVRESEREIFEPAVYYRAALTPGRTSGTCEMSHLRKKPGSNVMAGSCDIPADRRR